MNKLDLDAAQAELKRMKAHINKNESTLSSNDTKFMISSIIDTISSMIDSNKRAIVEVSTEETPNTKTDNKEVTSLVKEVQGLKKRLANLEKANKTEAVKEGTTTKEVKSEEVKEVKKDDGTDKE